MKELHWLFDSKEVLKSFPEEVRTEAGFSLYEIQKGGTPENSKPLQGLGKGIHGVYEIVVDHDKETYRVMYVAKFKSGVYVLSAFQKKSKTGKGIPIKDKELIVSRYKAALERDTS